LFVPDETKPSEDPAPARPGGADRLDVKGMIREASRRVSVQDLVKKGTKTISVLSKDKIDEMVNLAVKNIVAKYRALAAGFGDVSAEQLEKESQAEFQDIYQQYQETNKAKQTLEQTAGAMSAEIEQLQKELQTQKSIAEGKLSEEAEKLLIVGFKEFEHELMRIAGKVFEKRKLMIEGGDTPEAVAEWKPCEERLSAIIKKLIEQQRELFFGAGGKYARDREVAMLEARLAKMASQFKAMEEALRAISNQKLLTNQNIQNLLRGLGMLDDDKYAEKRKGMLKVVLQQNIKLRQDLKEFEAKQAAATGAPAPAAPPASSGEATPAA
jgi:hypothetical protein